MATIGQQLLTPEAGWRRYDDTDVSISYDGGFMSTVDNSHYNKTIHYNTDGFGVISFNFTGEKIRLITFIGNNRTTTNYVKIDGEKFLYSEYTVIGQNQTLVFEKLNLTNREHSVEIGNETKNGYLTLDAIDIDATGELRPYSTSKKLMLIQDSANKIINRDMSGWTDTMATGIYNTTFSIYGTPLRELTKLSETDWQNLYTSFTPPFKFYMFKEEDVISQNKLKSTYSQNDYTVARSYEVEINETDLQKVKSLSVV